MKLLVVVAFAAACGHGQKGGNGSGDGSAAGTGSGAGSAVAADAPITRAECEQMVGHLFDLQIATLKERPPESEITEARTKVLASEEGMQKCLAFDRPSWTCVMAAGELAALGKCSGPE